MSRLSTYGRTECEDRARILKQNSQKDRKRIYVFNHCLTWGKFSQANGQEGRGAENTIVLCNVVVFLHENGEHSAETYYNSIVQ